MRRRTIIAGLLPCLIAGVASAQATQATTEPAGEPTPSLPQAKLRNSFDAMADLIGLPVINAKSIDEVFKLSLKDKQIVLDPLIAPTDQALLRIPKFPGITRVKLFPVEEAGSPSIVMHFDFENRDYTVPNAICQYTTATLTTGSVTLTQMLETLDDQAHSVQLLQNTVAGEESPHVTLFVQIEGEPRVRLQLSAENVVELRRKYPGEVAKYVDPIFRALRQDPLLARVDSRQAWQVFADSFKPSSELARQVADIVKALDAQGFRERESASQKLDALGQPAALYLMQFDRKGLTDEQTSRIDTFVAKYRVVTDEQAAALRKDRDFLLDCLSSGELAIRQAAIGELRQITGKELAFDVNADITEREAGLARLRDAIGTPSTREAKD